MHARLDQLLSLADDPAPDPGVANHVAACAACRERLAALEVTRRALRSLGSLQPATDVWAGVQHRIVLRARRRRLAATAAAVAAAASVASLGILLGWRLLDGADRAQPAADRALHAVDSGELPLLRDRSRSLELALAALPERPAVGRAATALAIDDLQAQVQWIDHRLTAAAADPAPPADATRLWRERVELLNSLVQLRLVETQGTTL